MDDKTATRYGDGRWYCRSCYRNCDSNYCYHHSGSDAVVDNGAAKRNGSQPAIRAIRNELFKFNKMRKQYNNNDDRI